MGDDSVGAGDGWRAAAIQKGLIVTFGDGVAADHRRVVCDDRRRDGREGWRGRSGRRGHTRAGSLKSDSSPLSIWIILGFSVSLWEERQIIRE